MKCLVVDRDFLVVDDLLDPATFAALGRELAGGAYESVHARGWDKAWRLGDGAPLRGSAVYYDPAKTIDRPGPRYPTASSVDVVIDAVRALAEEQPHVVGREGNDWSSIFLSPWLYPVGSALSLHRDGGAYTGAFTFFAHPRWGVHWGGELLLLDSQTTTAHQHGQGSTGWLHEDDVDSLLATCVFPRPNRLVLVGPARPHMITRVDVNAGDHVRTTLAGFFIGR